MHLPLSEMVRASPRTGAERRVQRDYVMRMIEQMAAAIARMRRNIPGGDPAADEELRRIAAGDRIAEIRMRLRDAAP